MVSRGKHGHQEKGACLCSAAVMAAPLGSTSVPKQWLAWLLCDAMTPSAGAWTLAKGRGYNARVSYVPAESSALVQRQVCGASPAALCLTCQLQPTCMESQIVAAVQRLA